MLYLFLQPFVLLLPCVRVRAVLAKQPAEDLQGEIVYAIVSDRRIGIGGIFDGLKQTIAVLDHLPRLHVTILISILATVNFIRNIITRLRLIFTLEHMSAHRHRILLILLFVHLLLFPHLLDGNLQPMHIVHVKVDPANLLTIQQLDHILRSVGQGPCEESLAFLPDLLPD